MFETLDGRIAGPRGELDWMPGNGTPDREVDLAVDALFDTVDTILLGRKTYELFVDFWPTATTDQEFIADTLNSKTKVVFSNTLESVLWGAWDNARLATRPLVEEIELLKRLPGKDMVVFGGAVFAQELLRHPLLDELYLIVAPIVLGAGTPLFADGESFQRFELLEARRFSSGAVLLRYSPQT